MSRNYLFLPILLFCILSCSDQKIDTTKAREEMEAREIKVVSDARILDQAMDLGNELSKSFSLEAIPEPITETYVFNIDFGTDSLYQKDYYFFDMADQLSGKSLMVLEAYKYNRDNGIQSEPNVQKIENGVKLLYTKPMMANDTTLVGMWSIIFSRKQIVLSIKD